jgi:hypothetical protein
LGFRLLGRSVAFGRRGERRVSLFGGLNLELLQLDEGATAEARIQTLAFEPFEFAAATSRLADLGLEIRVAEKWESNPDLLKLRGFDEVEALAPQLICRNAYPTDDVPIDFFICDYSSSLRKRLEPSSFPGLSPVTHVILSTPQPSVDWQRINGLFGVPAEKGGVEICIAEEIGEDAEVIEIRLDRGPIDLGKWPARFCFS